MLRLLLVRPFASAAASAASTSTVRTGVLAVKLGMTAEWDAIGTRVPLTVLQLPSCRVAQVKTTDSDGYDAIQVAALPQKEHRMNKPALGHLTKLGLPALREIREFRITPDAALTPNTPLTVDHFLVGQHVDVSGTSVGKGFQGPMKRWGFGGLRASHGVSVVHRSHGSTGNRQDPGRVFKGKKMAGHMGNERITVQNLVVYKIDSDRQLLFVKGAVPGPENGLIEVRDSVKMRKEHAMLPVPTGETQTGVRVMEKLLIPKNVVPAGSRAPKLPGQAKTAQKAAAPEGKK